MLRYCCTPWTCGKVCNLTYGKFVPQAQVLEVGDRSKSRPCLLSAFSPSSSYWSSSEKIRDCSPSGAKVQYWKLLWSFEDSGSVLKPNPPQKTLAVTLWALNRQSLPSSVCRLRHTVGYCTSHNELNQPKTRLKHPPWPRRRINKFAIQTINTEHWIYLHSTTNKSQNTCCQSDFSNFRYSFVRFLHSPSRSTFAKFDSLELFLYSVTIANYF